jgi:hypothetical protein
MRNGRFASMRRNAGHKYMSHKNGYKKSHKRMSYKNGYKSRMSHKNGYKMHKRNRGSSRRNPADMTVRAKGMISGLARKIPFLGPKVAPFVAPALTGALSFIPVHFALKYGGQYVPDMVKPMAYTLSGVAIALLAAALPTGLTKSFKGILGASAVAAGATVDAFRYFSGSSDFLEGGGMGAIDMPGYGDGMAYNLGGLGLQGGDMGAIEVLGDYSDAVMADAAWSGPDFSAMEGEAALSGPGPWRRRFRAPPIQAKRQAQHTSRHAGRPGHRWGWLIKLVGFENFRKIAALPAQQRMAFIDKLRKDSVAAVVGLTEADVQIENGMSGLGLDMNGLGSPLYAGAAY